MRRAAPTSESGHRPRVARALALAATLLLSAGCDRGSARHEGKLAANGGDVRVVVRGATQAKVDQALADAAKQVAARETEWHPWHPSAVTALNAALRRGDAAPAPASVLRLIERSRVFAKASDGLLDPAVGSLVALWGFHTDRFPLAAPVPGKADIAAWMATRPRLDQVRVDGDRVASSNPRVQLDFSAILEGVTAAELAALLRRHGLHDARMEFGGDTAVIGSDGGAPWQVGFKDPFGGQLGAVALGNGEAFFTSGNYDKFRPSTSGGRWGHVLDPRTGMPARGAAAVAVLSDDPVLADAASTALMVGGPSAFARLARQLGAGCALMVTEENELLITAAMRRRVEFARDPIPLGAPVDAGGDCKAPK